VRDELVRRRVEEEDGARVDAEGITDPLEELLESFLERQVRERSVGDGLEPAQALGRRVRVLSGRGRPFESGCA
jgi:hypothetical protein